MTSHAADEAPGARSAESGFRLPGEQVAAMGQCHVPGVALGVAQGDAAYTAGIGAPGNAHPQSVDAYTLFQIGSITNTRPVALSRSGPTEDAHE